MTETDLVHCRGDRTDVEVRRNVAVALDVCAFCRQNGDCGLAAARTANVVDCMAAVYRLQVLVSCDACMPTDNKFMQYSLRTSALQ